MLISGSVLDERLDTVEPTWPSHWLSNVSKLERDRSPAFKYNEAFNL